MMQRDINQLKNVKIIIKNLKYKSQEEQMDMRNLEDVKYLFRNLY